MSKELVLICNEDGKWQAYESDHSVVIVCASQEEQDRACEILSKIGTDDDLRDAIFTSPAAIAAKLKAYCESKDLSWDNLERVKVTIICEAMALVLSGEYEEVGA